jgi:hypothetical protein
MSELPKDFPSMNPNDPTTDAWRVPRAALQGDRPPRLIDLNRYPHTRTSIDRTGSCERKQLHPGQSPRIHAWARRPHLDA